MFALTVVVEGREGGVWVDPDADDEADAVSDDAIENAEVDAEDKEND